MKNHTIEHQKQFFSLHKTKPTQLGLGKQNISQKNTDCERLRDKIESKR